MLYRCCIQLNDSSDLFTMTDLCAVSLDGLVLLLSDHGHSECSPSGNPHTLSCVSVLGPLMLYVHGQLQNYQLT